MHFDSHRIHDLAQARQRRVTRLLKLQQNFTRSLLLQSQSTSVCHKHSRSCADRSCARNVYSNQGLRSGSHHDHTKHKKKNLKDGSVGSLSSNSYETANRSPLSYQTSPFFYHILFYPGTRQCIDKQAVVLQILAKLGARRKKNSAVEAHDMEAVGRMKLRIWMYLIWSSTDGDPTSCWPTGTCIALSPNNSRAGKGTNTSSQSR